jgi:hypothetical protein
MKNQEKIQKENTEILETPTKTDQNTNTIATNFQEKIIAYKISEDDNQELLNGKLFYEKDENVKLNANLFKHEVLCDEKNQIKSNSNPSDGFAILEMIKETFPNLKNVNDINQSNNMNLGTSTEFFLNQKNNLNTSDNNLKLFNPLYPSIDSNNHNSTDIEVINIR